MHVVLLAYMDKSMHGDAPGVRDQRGQRGYPASKARMTARLPKAAATANMEREKKIKEKKGMRGSHRDATEAAPWSATAVEDRRNRFRSTRESSWWC